MNNSISENFEGAAHIHAHCTAKETTLQMYLKHHAAREQRPKALKISQHVSVTFIFKSGGEILEMRPNYDDKI